MVALIARIESLESLPINRRTVFRPIDGTHERRSVICKCYKLNHVCRLANFSSSGVKETGRHLKGENVAHEIEIQLEMWTQERFCRVIEIFATADLSYMSTCCGTASAKKVVPRIISACVVSDKLNKCVSGGQLERTWGNLSKLYSTRQRLDRQSRRSLTHTHTHTHILQVRLWVSNARIPKSSSHSHRCRLTDRMVWTAVGLQSWAAPTDWVSGHLTPGECK